MIKGTIADIVAAVLLELSVGHGLLIVRKLDNLVRVIS
jgi:hypothetical protein